MHHIDELQPTFTRYQRLGLVVGVVASVVLVLSAVIPGLGLRQFLQSYLYGYLFWLGLSLGCLSVILLHHLVAGAWGYMIQRFCEAAAQVVLLMAVLFIPIALGIHYLFPWTSDTFVENWAAVAAKTQYLNVPFFFLRAAIYFIIWIGLAYSMAHFSRRLDQTGDAIYILRMRAIGAVGLVIYVLTMTFASVDWSMSLEPEWFSSMYGPIFIVGQGLTGLAFGTFLLTRLYDRTPFRDVTQTRHFHHLGNLILAFVVLWAYVSFSQYLIIWSGNLPEEIPWYLRRTGTAYQIITVILIVFHFVVPFFVLLIRRAKRGTKPLAILCAAIFFMHAVDLFWIVTPAFLAHPGEASEEAYVMVSFGSMLVHLFFDIVAWLAIGGIWTAAFLYFLPKRYLIPIRDERIAHVFIQHDPSGTDIAQYNARP